MTKVITIAGGGLAGLALGIGLRNRGVAVEVYEASSFPRHRVCGEFLSGVSDDTLNVLGICDSLNDAEVLRTTAWYDQSGRMFSAELPSPARGISRYRLDDRLALRFQELGGVFHGGQRFPVAPYAGEGLVRATGRSLDKTSEWLGLKAHFLDFDIEADLEMHLGNNGYVGLSRVEDGRVNVAGLFRKRKNVKAKGAESLCSYTSACGLETLASRLELSNLDDASCVGVSSFGFGLKRAKRGGSFRIGDQRALIPPFTGNGMSMALQSAELALPCLEKYSLGDCSWSESQLRYEEESGRFFVNRLRFARWVHPLIFSVFGQRVVGGMARGHLLPFSMLYRSLR